MNRRRKLPTLVLAAAALVAASLFMAALAFAQAARPTPALDAGTRTEVVAALREELLRRYVEADTARLIADVIEARHRDGAYDRLTTPSDFAEALTRDLRRINDDLHLSVRFDPAGGGDGAPRIVRRGPGDAPHSGRRVVREGAGGAARPGERVVVREGGRPGALPDSAFGDGPPPWEREALERNFGLARVEILPGNVGYFEITGFMEGPGMEESLVAALEFLRHTEAVIVDLRRNGGGSGNMTHLFYSHFFPATPVPTVRVKSRQQELNRDMQTFAEVPGPRRPAVPLYVLTSRFTGSAAEEVAFVLQNHRRATLVGDRTGGAGHMVGSYTLPHGFIAMISITRVSDPATGREWEAVGVQPDVRVAPERALAAAHAAALRRIAADAPSERRTRLERVAAFVEARDRDPLPAARLAPLAGTYEGDREVRLENGRLWFQRLGGMREELIAIGDRSFSLNGQATLTFAAGSPAPSLHVERADGSTGSYRRVSARVESD